MGNRVALLIATSVTLVGAVLTLWAALASRKLTGEWLGYPLPDEVCAAMGIGIFAFIIGVMLLLAIGMLSSYEFYAVQNTLNNEIVDDQHPVARIGRTILRAHRMVNIGIGILLLLLIVYGAFQDPLMACVLWTAVLAVIVVWYLARRNRESGDGHPDSHLPNDH
jgi:hypothetical protein